MAVRLPFSATQYWDATNKEPYAGAKMFTYAAGTTTDKDTYTTSTEAVARANPVIADANGIFPEIYGSGNYNIVIKNSAESVTIYEADNIAASDLTPAFSTKITATGTYTTPANATMLRVTCKGAGGGGAGIGSATGLQGGGGGEGATSIVYVTGTLLSSYAVTVSSGGTGGTSAIGGSGTSGAAGGDTTFAISGGANLCVAKGGSAGLIAGIGGRGGLASGGTGKIMLDGVAGGNAQTEPSGGSGVVAGGTGGGTGGGTYDTAIDAITNSGGGGAGVALNNTGPATIPVDGGGGNGADGHVLVEYWV